MLVPALKGMHNSTVFKISKFVINSINDEHLVRNNFNVLSLNLWSPTFSAFVCLF